MAGQGARRTPVRMCVVCRERQGQRGLLRVARLPSGQVVVDPTGKGAGRGAYLCPRRACWLHKDMPRRLAHALKTVLSSDDRAVLLAFAASLPETEDHG